MSTRTVKPSCGLQMRFGKAVDQSKLEGFGTPDLWQNSHKGVLLAFT